MKKLKLLAISALVLSATAVTNPVLAKENAEAATGLASWFCTFHSIWCNFNIK